MLLLILSYRHDRCVIQKNVGCHEHRVVEGSDANFFILRLSVLEGVRALKVRHSSNCIEDPSKLGMRWNIRLLKERELRRVKTCGHIAGSKIEREFAHLRGVLD